MNKIIKDGKSLDDAINLFLFDYRSTVHCTTGRSPAWLMFKRELRTRFDLLKPDVLATVEQKQYDQKVSVDGKRKIDLNPGDNIFAKDFRVSSKGRSEGIIVKENSPSTFNVKFKYGTISKKHKNQLIKTKFRNNEGERDSKNCVSKNKPQNIELPRRSLRLKSKKIKQ